MQAFALRFFVLFVGLPVGLALLFGAPLWPLLVGYAGYALLLLWGARSSARARSSNASSVAFLLFLIFGLPPAFASVVAASWQAIGLAYVLWFGVLGLWAAQGLLSRRATSGEALGWPLIAAMFLTMAVVPLLALVLTVKRLA